MPYKLCDSEQPFCPLWHTVLGQMNDLLIRHLVLLRFWSVFPSDEAYAAYRNSENNLLQAWLLHQHLEQLRHAEQ